MQQAANEYILASTKILNTAHRWQMVVIWVGPLLVFISARYWERKSACGRYNGWQTVGPTMLSSN